MSTDYLSLHPLRQALKRLSRHELADRLARVRTLSAGRGLRFLDDHSRPKLIDLASVPWILTQAQLRFFRGVAHTLVGALARLPSLYAQHPDVRAIIPFDRQQESWLRLSPPLGRGPLAVLGRLDSTATFNHAAWRTDFQMLEPNAVGVGGVHYAPTAGSVILHVFGDLLAAAYPGRRVVALPDPRRLLIEELEAVGRQRGRRLRGLALIENTDYTTGTDEFGSLARYFNHHGLKAVVADPRDVRVRGGRVMAKGAEIDFCYRDCELGEFLEMEDDGHRLNGMREVVRQGRLVSGLLWEFDQKSCWELFSDPTHAHFFTPAQRRFFRAHVPWTRLVRETYTTDPRGRRVDLIAHIRRRKNQLVLKPNTLYGGQGVVVGHTASQAVWEKTLEKAMRGKERYVVQGVARIQTERFPMLEGGRPHEVERSVVAGFFFNSTNVGLIGRFSSNPVVNVSRGGGLLSALMVQ